MPYIVTTKARKSPDPLVHPQVVSRAAVATLEQARKAASGLLDWRGTCEHITAEGGTISLNGTMIEVLHAPINPYADAQDWCDIYNGHHAVAS